MDVVGYLDGGGLVGKLLGDSNLSIDAAGFCFEELF